MTVTTVTTTELSNGIQDPCTPPATRKVLSGILNDYMDLAYGKETPYTTGKQVIPSECTIEDVDKAIGEKPARKFHDIFVKISETYKSGDLTPQTDKVNWDPKLKPVLVFVAGSS